MTGRNILETGRLALRVWNSEDVDPVFALHSQADVSRYLPGGLPWTREEAAEQVAGWARHYEIYGVAKLKLVRLSDGRFIGRAGFAMMAELDEFELGYTIAPEYQGIGYATEIAGALARTFLRSGVRNRFIAIAHVDNLASLKVMAKIGMRFERTTVMHSLPCHVYAMARESA